jgi:hypothetical protein
VPAFPRTVAAVPPSASPLVLSSSGFGSGGYGQQPDYGAGSGVNPYANPPGVGMPPPHKSNAWLWILGIVGILGIGMVVCCGGFGYWGFSQGMNMVADMAKKEAEDHPAVQEHLGGIASASMNFVKSTEETQKRGTGTNFFVIDVKGENETDAELIVEQSKDPAPGEMFSTIDLRLPSGEEISIK